MSFVLRQNVLCNYRQAEHAPRTAHQLKLDFHDACFHIRCEKRSSTGNGQQYKNKYKNYEVEIISDFQWHICIQRYDNFVCNMHIQMYTHFYVLRNLSDIWQTRSLVICEPKGKRLCIFRVQDKHQIYTLFTVSTLNCHVERCIIVATAHMFCCCLTMGLGPYLLCQSDDLFTQIQIINIVIYTCILSTTVMKQMFHLCHL